MLLFRKDRMASVKQELHTKFQKVLGRNMHYYQDIADETSDLSERLWI